MKILLTRNESEISFDSTDTIKLREMLVETMRKSGLVKITGDLDDDGILENVLMAMLQMADELTNGIIDEEER